MKNKLLILVLIFSFLLLPSCSTNPPDENEVDKENPAISSEELDDSLIFSEAGEYGSAELPETVLGDLIITATDVKLQNYTVLGNLILSEEVEAGEVQLKNVSVAGELILENNGETKLVLDGCLINNLQALKTNTHVSAINESVIHRATLTANIEVETDKQSRFSDVTIAQNADVKLTGTFADITMTHAMAKAQIAGTVERLALEADATVNLQPNTTVKNLTIKAGGEITGDAVIEQALVMAFGAKMSMMPKKIEFISDETILIKGEIISAAKLYHKDQTKTNPDTQTEKTPVKITPSKPKEMKVTPLKDGTVKVDEVLKRKLEVNPLDAIIIIDSSNKSVASVSLLGRELRVTGHKAGTAVITVTFKKQGYKNETISFKVTVEKPVTPPPPPPPPTTQITPVVEKLENTPLFGSTTIRITLQGTSNPEKYKVSVGQTQFVLRNGKFEYAVVSGTDLADLSVEQIKAQTVITAK